MSEVTLHPRLRLLVEPLLRDEEVDRLLPAEGRSRAMSAFISGCSHIARASQTGESAVDLKRVLGSKTVEDLDLDASWREGEPYCYGVD